MKKSIILPSVFVLSALLSISSLRGQTSNLNITLGAGMPELLHAGVSLNARKVIFGATAGIFPVFGENLFTASLNTGLHFAGKSEYTEIPPWYALAGFNLVRERTDFSESRYTYLSIRIGREMNFSPRTAFAVDGGLLFETSHRSRGLDPVTIWQPGESWFPVLPALSLKMIFRL